MNRFKLFWWGSLLFWGMNFWNFVFRVKVEVFKSEGVFDIGRRWGLIFVGKDVFRICAFELILVLLVIFVWFCFSDLIFLDFDFLFCKMGKIIFFFRFMVEMSEWDSFRIVVDIEWGFNKWSCGGDEWLFFEEDGDEV